MTATETDLAALLAAVEAAPADDAPKLVLADWLADHDAHPDAEAAIRWCVRAERWPGSNALGPEGNFRFWWGAPWPPARPHCLPADADGPLIGDATWHAPDLLTLMDATGRALAASGHLGGPCDLLGTEAPGF